MSRATKAMSTARLQSAAKHVEADYFVPYYAHAPMEAPIAVANVVGGNCETWARRRSRRPRGRRSPRRLACRRGDVTVNVTLLGGGFGRKSKPDYVAEAALLSKIGAPVKVTWTREDEIQHDYYHAIAPSISKRDRTPTARRPHGFIGRCFPRSNRRSSPT